MTKSSTNLAQNLGFKKLDHWVTSDRHPANNYFEQGKIVSCLFVCLFVNVMG